jgi:hypothetical protein
MQHCKNHKYKTTLASILLVSSLLWPSIIRLEHQHHHFECHAHHHKHLHTYHEICDACNFEFSMFLPAETQVQLTSVPVIDNYLNNYQNTHYANSPKYSFLLRAPPFNLL